MITEKDGSIGNTSENSPHTIFFLYNRHFLNDPISLNIRMYRASHSERSGAVADNSSSKGLLKEGSAHLSHNPLAHPKDAAKVKQLPHSPNETPITSLVNDDYLRGNI